MNIKTASRCIAFAVTVWSALNAWATSSAGDWIKASSGEIKLGEWNNNISKGLAYAEANHVPLLAFFSNPGCGHCYDLGKKCAQSDFLAWQKEKKIVMIFGEGNAAVKAFTKTDTTTLVDFPFIRVYWLKADGTKVSRNFTGRRNTMPAKGSATTSLGMLLAQSVDMLTEGYDPAAGLYSGGYFAVSNSVSARLEAEPTTDRMVIPLVRTATAAASQALVVQYPGETVSNTISWAANEKTKNFTLTGISSRYRANGTATLRLMNASGEAADSTAITFVPAVANSADNPYFVGERTAATLEAGEWTMDLEVAKQRVAANGGYILALVDGSLWCPDCSAASANLYGKAAFTDWAKDNNVTLVQIDTARKQNDSATRAPTLLTHDVDAINGKSGTAYLSRKGIAPADAEQIYRRNVTLTYTTWRESDSSGVRVAQPYHLILDKSGNVLARSDPYYGSNRSFPVDINLKRLNELLSVAGDASIRRDAYPATTALSLAVGSATDGTVNAVSKKAYKLTGLAAGDTVALTLTCINAGYALDILQKTASGYTNLVSKSGAATLTATATLATAGDCYARISPVAAALGDTADSTDTAYRLSAAKVLNPGTIAVAAAAGQADSGSDDSYSFTVRRTGGSAGAVSVSVSATPVNASRYSLATTSLTWADGDMSDKTVSVNIVKGDFGANFVATISLAKTSGEAALGAATHTLTMISSDELRFATTEVKASLTQYVAVEEAIAVKGLKGGRVTVKKAGKVPNGMKVKYDAATRALLIKGTPTRAGTFTSTWTVTESLSTGKVTGAKALTLAYTVRAIGSVNNALRAATTKISGIVVTDDDQLVGTLDLTIASKGRVQGKYASAAGSVSLASRAWTDVADNGSATAVATGNKGHRMSVTVSTSGAVTGTLIDPNYSGKTLLLDFPVKAWSSARPANAYVGYYTVALTSEPGSRVSGNGYLLLTIPASGAKAGKVTYKGMFPNGQGFSGRGVLMESANGGFAWLPILKKTSRDVIAGLLAIKANAAATYKDNPRIIDGDQLVWIHSEKTSAASFVNDLTAYGGYYSPTDDLKACCDGTYGTSTFPIDVKTEGLATSYGAVVSVPKANADVGSAMVASSDPSAIRLSFNRKTGIYKGSFRIGFAQKTVVVKYAGVLIIGWGDCGCDDSATEYKPFGMGACWFQDVVSGVSTKGGCAVNLGTGK